MSGLSIYSGRALIRSSVAEIPDHVVEWAFETNYNLTEVTERMSIDFTPGVAKGNITNRFSFTSDLLRDKSNFIDWSAIFKSNASIDFTLMMEGAAESADGTAVFDGVAIQMQYCQPMNRAMAGRGAGSAVSDSPVFFVQQATFIY